MSDSKCTPGAEENAPCPGFARLAVVESELVDLRRQNAKTHERFGERIGELESGHKVQDVEVKNLEKTIDRMSGDMVEVKAETKEISKQLPAIASQISAIHETSKAVDADVDALKEKPGKRWESVVGQIIGLVVAALVGLVLARLGM